MARSRNSASRSSVSGAGTGASQRQLRVGEEIRHVLARLVERGALSDPVLAGRSLTITEVRLSPDLKNATAFVTPLGGEAGAATVKALNHARAYLRGLVAQEVRLRHAPRLSFVLDTSFEQAGRISRILAEVAPQEPQSEEGGGDGA